MHFQLSAEAVPYAAAAAFFLASALGLLWVLSLGRRDRIRCEEARRACITTLHEAQEETETWRERAQALERDYAEIERDYAVLHTRFEDATASHAKQMELLEAAKASLALQFENLAHTIFEQKSRAFDTANREQMTLLLRPFREQIERFAQQIQQRYDTESKERHLLKDEIARLKQLNERISDDAVALTNALKGENKTQGMWGEMVLARVLEISGLRRGREFELQPTYRDKKGRMLRPDAVVMLPQRRSVVVDAKVSLVAYERFVRAAHDAERTAALKEHLRSVRAHVKELSSKRYDTIEQLHTLDFVLLFMPVEGAFQAALEHDDGLFKQAYDAHIVIAGPSTLLATLRTIEHLWRGEHRQRNAQHIAAEAEALYDKFVAFVEEMQRVGEGIERAKSSWETAMQRLSSGKGNLIGRAEKMRRFGLDPKKRLETGDEA